MIRRRFTACLMGLTLGLSFGAVHAVAEVAPQTISGGAGMMNLNSYSVAYKPTSKTMAVMSAGIDGRITPRFSVMLRTTSSVDETFSAGDRLVDHAGESHHAEAVADAAEGFATGGGVS